jgi:hypothetical protein
MPSPRSSAWPARPDPDPERSSSALSGTTELAEVSLPKGRAAARGSVLLQVLFLSVLGLLLSSLLLSGLLVQAHSLNRSRRAPQVSYAAESGVHQTIQHLVNTITQEDGEIEQFRVLAAVWNRPAPFTGEVGHVRYEARVVDVSPNLAFRAYVRRYADVTLEAAARQDGLPPQVIRATYRLSLGPTTKEGKRATRLLWQKI